MLNNLTNFYSIIKGRMLRKSTTIKGTDIIPLGVVNPNYDGGYAPSAITVEDFVDSLPTPSLPTLQDVLDNNHELINGNNFQGTNAGDGSSGVNTNAFGQSAAQNCTGNEINVIGTSAGINNTGDSLNAIGENAGADNTGSLVNAMGLNAANRNMGDRVIALGQSAAYMNKGTECVFLGTSAGEANGANSVIGLGAQSAAGNLLANMFVVSKDYLPQYPDKLAAAAAINLGTGAAPGQFYFYWDSGSEVIRVITT